MFVSGEPAHFELETKMPLRKVLRKNASIMSYTIIVGFPQRPFPQKRVQALGMGAQMYPFLCLDFLSKSFGYTSLTNNTQEQEDNLV